MKETPPKDSAIPTSKFTLDEVGRHATPTDCWIVIKGKVYDVSNWADEHPGGKAVYALGGQDATDVFATFHPMSAYKMLAPHCIGEVLDAAPVPELLRDFRALKVQLQKQGLFESRKTYYAFKVASNFTILAVAIALLVHARSYGNGAAPHPLAFMTLLTSSALALGLFWQQMGWLAHDVCHHQVFSNRARNNAFAYLLGNVCQGFSVDWWKSKHNLHHAAPNELTAGQQAVDPDIDTLPLFAWSPSMLASVDNRSQLTLVRVQQYLFFPVLLFARFNWALGSIAHAFELAKKTRRGKFEVLLLAVHYGWYFGLAFALLPFPQALLYAALAQMFSGALLAIVFVQSHNGMEVYSDRKDFVTAQVVSTRDIASSAWNDWFTGGLDYQIEHHLFPTLPRHNLAKTRKPVMDLCAKHGLVYEECGMTESTLRVVRCLADIAAQARERTGASIAAAPRER